MNKQIKTLLQFKLAQLTIILTNFQNLIFTKTKCEISIWRSYFYFRKQFKIS